MTAGYGCYTGAQHTVGTMVITGWPLVVRSLRSTSVIWFIGNGHQTFLYFENCVQVVGMTHDEWEWIRATEWVTLPSCSFNFRWRNISVSLFCFVYERSVIEHKVSPFKCMKCMNLYLIFHWLYIIIQILMYFSVIIGGFSLRWSLSTSP